MSIHEATGTTTLAFPTAEELDACAAVLRAVRAHPELTIAKDPAVLAVRAEANKLIATIKQEAGRVRAADRRDESRVARREGREHDRAAVLATGIRTSRTGTNVLRVEESSSELVKPKHCYVCKQAYTRLHGFYDALCFACGEENWAKRGQSADLHGRVALVTGGRMKIGQRVALRLLRAGASVIVTTRFPYDAARRFGAEPDFGSFAPRLEIHGLDLRSLGMVERAAARIADTRPWIDVIVNNAAQTVRRPSRYYAHLLEGELAGAAALPPELKAVVAHADDPSSALLSQVPLLEEDAREDDDAFPPGALTRDGQQVDRRIKNSWELALGEVERVELLEVHHVNAFAPFVLLNRPLPLLKASPHAERFVINVSAMEGKFDYGGKLATHPHTNMAKAALNMLTRTSGPALAKEGVYMTSVDTGWITNEHAFPTSERMRVLHGFEPPLDEDDGAARVLDPVFGALLERAPLHSVFLKDYRATTW